jgi:hypothetical protein
MGGALTICVWPQLARWIRKVATRTRPACVPPLPRDVHPEHEVRLGDVFLQSSWPVRLQRPE